MKKACFESRNFAVSPQVREDDCVHFDDEVLASYSSWTAPVDNAPLHMALPPGRLEHEMNTRCVAQFMRPAVQVRRDPFI